MHQGALATGEGLVDAQLARDDVRLLLLVPEPDEVPAAQEVLREVSRLRVAVEAGATVGWWKYVGLDGRILGIDRFGDGPVIALNAHGDVVPPGDGWTQHPYRAEIVDGKLYGRAAAVSKSDFATYTYALRALIVVPEVGILSETVQLFEPPLRLVDVKDASSAAQRTA